MSKKFHVTLASPGDATIVKNSGCEIVAEYPDTLVVRCDAQQLQALQSQGIELAEMPTPQVQVSGLTFSMADAVATESAMPAPDPSRKTYYLAQLVGPAKGEWLQTLSSRGVEVIGKMSGDVLLLRMLPDKVATVRGESWVEGITSYRPAMKISPKLKTTSKVLGATELAATPESMVQEKEQMIELTVFPGEPMEDIALKLQAKGAKIISKGKQSVRAIVSPVLITAMAQENSVATIQPFAFPVLHNDVARTVMAVPENGFFARSGELQGNGQIVAVADTGLDTGNAETVHQDFRGRIEAIISWGTSFDPSFAPLINGPFITDDGTADTNIGHGTHVAGSVLGNGTAAAAAGATSIPRGTAPQARLYFQAVEQQVNWKSAAQLRRERIPVPVVPGVPGGWPPLMFGLYGLPNDLNTLFKAAYDAGARIHTNSWGAPDFGLYNENSRAVDEFMWNKRDIIIIFSAGNSGMDSNSDGQIDLESIGSPGTAKNCLTVGATENNRPHGSTPTPGQDSNWEVLFGLWPTMGAAGHVSDNVEGMACFSSRGPAVDGRIKPDVVAPGTNVLSTRSSLVGADPLWGDVTPATNQLRGIYCWSGGTSMATPLVAGIAALVREHLVTKRRHFVNGVKPSGALIKAFIVNGARRMDGQFTGEILAGVNNVSGFGRVNAIDTITPSTIDRVAFDDEPNNAVESGQMRTYPISAANLSEPLKITLCWTDRHSPGAGGLQNTLYLQVVDPAGTVVDGDVTPYPTAMNNVQQVFFQTPIAGQYTIRVRGISVTQQAPGAATGPNPRQDFALVMSNGYGLNVPSSPFSLISPWPSPITPTSPWPITPISPWPISPIFTNFTLPPTGSSRGSTSTKATGSGKAKGKSK